MTPQLDEYNYLTQKAAVIPAAGYKLIVVAGKDAGDYLHRRLSQSIKNLREGQGRHALQLAGDARLISDLLVYRHSREFHCLADDAAAEETFALMDKYVLMDEVTVEKRWERETVIDFAGPLAPEILQQLAGDAVIAEPTEDSLNTCPSPWQTFQVAIGGRGCRVFRDGRWTVPYYHLSVMIEDGDEAYRALAAACRAAGGGTARADAVEYLRVSQGITQFGRDTDPKTIPLEAGLTDAIDFNKGCFPGQEFLARIKNLGHPANLFARFQIEGEHEIESGSAINIDGEEAGVITSAKTVPGIGKTVAMGMIKWKHRHASDANLAAVGAGIAINVIEVADKDRYADEPYRPKI